MRVIVVQTTVSYWRANKVQEVSQWITVIACLWTFVYCGMLSGFAMRATSCWSRITVTYTSWGMVYQFVLHIM